MKYTNKWELVAMVTQWNSTHRLQVPGGWLVRHTILGCKSDTVAMVFVADEHYEWELQES